MNDIDPADSSEVHAFMLLYRRLCPTVYDEVTLEEFSRQLGWSHEQTLRVAMWLDERELIETDRGFGEEITLIEGNVAT